MRRPISLALSVWALLAAPCLAAQDPPRSLAEAAQKEAERRRTLESQGVQAKVITGAGPSAPGSGVSVTQPAQKKLPTGESRYSSGEKKDLRSIRSELQRLDRQILAEGDRLTVLKNRAETLRKENAVRLRRPSSPDGRGAEDRLRNEIQLLEKKIARLRDDRRRSYDSGRRAGFLPGELDGRGMTP